MRNKKKIGILTGGGDCPGLNAVIRAVTKKVITEQNCSVIGYKDGYHGLVNNDHIKLDFDAVSGILTQGGTILGTSKIANPYRYPIKKNGKLVFRDLSKNVVKNVKKLGLDCLVCIGGDGSLGISNSLNRDGIPVVGVPKTIDNDIKGTEITFGFDSAVTIATEGVDRLHTTAQSHHRIMIIEVMGHNAGWIALHSGVAGGGDIILIPEIPYDMGRIVDTVKKRHKKGKRFSIVVIAEGAKAKGGKVVVKRIVEESADALRLGGVGNVLGRQIEDITGLETRTVVLGHLQRGGSPTAFDRVLATELGSRAGDLIEKNKFGYMVGIQRGRLVDVPLKDVAKGSRTIPKNHHLIQAARSVGTCFGD